MAADPMKPTAVGVHVFGGGFTLGTREHFQIAAHLEACRVGAPSWTLNNDREYHIPTTYDKKHEWKDALQRIKDTSYPVRYVYGNPPCSAFSSASASGKERGPGASIAWWARDVVRVGAELGAEVTAVESVRGALKHAAAVHGKVWEEFRSVYPAQMWVLVNTYDVGLPQWRPRVFWVLAKTLFPWRRPAAPKVSVMDVLTGIPPDAPNQQPTDPYIFNLCNLEAQAEMLAEIPTLRHGETFMAARVQKPAEQYPMPAFRKFFETRKVLMHLPVRLHPDRPSPVVYSAHARFIHPYEHRALTVRELSRLNGFPDTFEWKGSTIRQLADLGRGVCPPIAAWLASEVKAHLWDERADRGPGTAVVDVASSAPHAVPDQQLTWMEGG
jgi:DNA (cytosine-5)-methyltransferase 1